MSIDVPDKIDENPKSLDAQESSLESIEPPAESASSRNRNTSKPSINHVGFRTKSILYSPNALPGSLDLFATFADLSKREFS